MDKQTNEYNLEKIYKRLDQISIFIEHSLSEIDDINEIRSIVEDLRSSLLKTIDDRVEYIMGKQRDIYELKLSQIEENIKNISKASREDICELKERVLSNIKQMKLQIDSSMQNTNNKIDSHLRDKINWKQIIVPTIVTTFVSIGVIIFVAVLDYYFNFGILDILDKFKP